MRLIRATMSIALAATMPGANASSQVAPRPVPAPYRLPLPSSSSDDRSGPRFGLAYVAGGSVTAENAGEHVAPVMTLFGWQFEKQFDTGEPTLPTPMTELVALAGGMEQGAFLPSVSWLIGVRKPTGWEAAVGPTLTGAGIQLAIAAGVTHAVGKINVPVNLAVAPGRRGAAISITSGFNVRRTP